MIISIDTEVMNKMAVLANSANEEMERNSALMAAIVEHSDWCCAERNIINENISKVKFETRKLQELISDFAGTVSSVAKQFDDEEKAIPGKYEYLDVLFGKTYTSTVSEDRDSAVMTEYVTQEKTFDFASTLESYEYANVTEPIQMVKFKDVDFSVASNGDILSSIGDLNFTDFANVLGPGGNPFANEDFVNKIKESFESMNVSPDLISSLDNTELSRIFNIQMLKGENNG